MTPNFDLIQLKKYEGEQSKWHDVELIYPGIDCFPVIKEENLGNKFAETYTIYPYFHSKLFDLSNKDDVEHYNWVKDRIVSGWFRLLKEETKWVSDQKILIYLEWVQRYVKLLFAN